MSRRKSIQQQAAGTLTPKQRKVFMYPVRL